MASPLSVETGSQLPLIAIEAAQEVQTHILFGEASLTGRRKVPWTAEIPAAELSYDGLVLLIPGFGCVQQFSDAERHANAVAGEATISYEPPRISENSLQSLRNSQAIHAAAARAVLNDVRACLTDIIGIPNVRGISADRTVLSAHSMGGLTAASLASETPGEYSAIIYKAAVGFGAPEFKLRQLLSLLTIGAEMTRLAAYDRTIVSQKTARRISAYHLGHLMQSAGEITACLQNKLIDTTHRLSDKGVPSAYVGFEHDRLISPRLIEPNLLQTMEAYQILPGLGHLAPQKNPVITAATVRSLRHSMTA